MILNLFVAGLTISYLKFSVSETADSLIVAANNDSDGFIEIWELSEKTPPVHQAFQSKNCESFKTYVKTFFYVYIFLIPIQIFDSKINFRSGNIKRYTVVHIV